MGGFFFLNPCIQGVSIKSVEGAVLSLYGVSMIHIALLPIQLFANVSGKASRDGLSTWVPATCVGDLDVLVGVWL